MSTRTLSARLWNEWIARLGRSRLLHALKLDGGGWQHPWQTSARWNADEERWEARVKAGFVNGLDPTIAVYDSKTKETRDVPLTEPVEPWLVLSQFRTPSPVPSYFVARGVAASVAPQGVDELLLGSGLAVADAAPATRIVVATDIVLHQPRAASRIDVQASQAGGADGIAGRVLVSYSGGASRSYVIAVKELVPDPPVDLPSLIDGSKSDSGVDKRLVSTVYLLSPEGVLEGEPDGTWTAHVQHARFWNLGYHATGTPGAVSDDLRLDVPLAGGIAQPIIGQILASVNDANSAVAQFLSARVAAGRFWTV